MYSRRRSRVHPSETQVLPCLRWRQCLEVFVERHGTQHQKFDLEMAFGESHEQTIDLKLGLRIHFLAGEEGGSGNNQQQQGMAASSEGEIAGPEGWRGRSQAGPLSDTMGRTW